MFLFSPKTTVPARSASHHGTDISSSLPPTSKQGERERLADQHVRAVQCQSSLASNGSQVGWSITMCSTSAAFTPSM